MKDISSTYQLETGTGAATVDLRADAARRRFLFALLLCTWIPLLFFISIARLETDYFSIKGMKTVFLFLGTAHVPATLFFYTDKKFSSIVSRHKARYIYFPLLLTVGAGLLVAFTSEATWIYLFLFFWAWQAFHYGRQNLGIYSFAAIAQGTGAPARLEKVAIDLATWCGILGTFRILGMGGAPEYMRGALDYLYMFGKYGYLAVIVFALSVYAKNFRQTTALKSIFFWTLILFFLPIYLSNDINITFLSYAIAHGLQYIVFMAIVSYSTQRAERARAVSYQNALKLVGLMIFVGLLFFNVDSLRAAELVKNNSLLVWSANFLFGAVLGATMAHFVVDAGAWRLSQLPQREYMMNSFGFIFTAKASGSKFVKADHP